MLFILHKDDSGGPLMVSNGNGHFVVAGVTSFGGANSGDSGMPRFYANVANVVNWINQNINGTLS